MPIINCPECGKEVSMLAKYCLNCGMPINIANNSDTVVVYEYKVISLDDISGFFKSGSGRVNIEEMSNTLNKLGLNGWHLVTAYSNELGKNALGGGIGGIGLGVNSTVDENILIFERPISISKKEYLKREGKIGRFKINSIISFDGFDIINTDEVYDGAYVSVLRLYCDQKTYDYKFNENFRKRNTPESFVNKCKEKHDAGAEEYLNALLKNKLFISFIEADEI